MARPGLCSLEELLPRQLYPPTLWMGNCSGSLKISVKICTTSSASAEWIQMEAVEATLRLPESFQTGKVIRVMWAAASSCVA